jgi:hypothetical protein
MRKHKCNVCLKMDYEDKMAQWPFNKKWAHYPNCPKDESKPAEFKLCKEQITLKPHDCSGCASYGKSCNK